MVLPTLKKTHTCSVLFVEKIELSGQVIDLRMNARVEVSVYV